MHSIHNGFILVFVNGLAIETQAFVEGYLPVTVIDAYCLAAIFDNGYSRSFSLSLIKGVVENVQEVAEPIFDNEHNDDKLDLITRCLNDVSMGDDGSLHSGMVWSQRNEICSHSGDVLEEIRDKGVTNIHDLVALGTTDVPIFIADEGTIEARGHDDHGDIAALTTLRDKKGTESTHQYIKVHKATMEWTSATPSVVLIQGDDMNLSTTEVFFPVIRNCYIDYIMCFEPGISVLQRLCFGSRMSIQFGMQPSVGLHFSIAGLFFIESLLITAEVCDLAIVNLQQNAQMESYNSLCFVWVPPAERISKGVLSKNFFHYPRASFSKIFFHYLIFSSAGIQSSIGLVIPADMIIVSDFPVDELITECTRMLTGSVGFLLIIG